MCAVGGLGSVCVCVCVCALMGVFPMGTLSEGEAIN